MSYLTKFATYFFFFLMMLIMVRTSHAEGRKQPKPAQVWNLTIKGNHSFSDMVLKNQIATSAFSFWDKLKFWKRKGHPFNKITVEKDAIRIRNYYHQHGFPNTQVTYHITTGNKSWKKNVSFVVDERPAIHIKQIQFVFNPDQYSQKVRNSDAFKNARRQSDFKPGARYATVEKPKIEGTYEDVFKNLGFAYANITIKAKVDTARLSANVKIIADLGPKTYIHKISVEGEKTVSKHYIIRETGLKKGELFSQKKLRDAQRQLYNHHLFRFATISIPKQKKDSTLDLQIHVRESPLHTVQTSIGFGSEDYVRGHVSWIDRNTFGTGDEFTATAKASFIKQLLNVHYLFPYVFNNKSSIDLSPFGEHLLEPSYELYQGGITNSFIYEYSQHLTGTVSYQLTRNFELSQRTTANLPDTTKAYNLSSFQISGYYNQGFSRQQKGWVVQPYAEFSGIFGNATFNFQKLSLDVRRYTPLTATTTLATRVEAGAINTAHTDSLPRNIRFFLGGTNSVRGWQRQELGPKTAQVDSVRNANGNVVADSVKFVRYLPVGGNAMAAFNIELRQSISSIIPKFGVAAFLDGGQVWNRVLSVGSRPIQFGVGGGIRYQSPIGPLRIDIGYKLNPTKKDLNIYKGKNYGSAWDRIGIHFSIGQAF